MIEKRTKRQKTHVRTNLPQSKIQNKWEGQQTASGGLARSSGHYRPSGKSTHCLTLSAHPSKLPKQLRRDRTGQRTARQNRAEQDGIEWDGKHMECNRRMRPRQQLCIVESRETSTDGWMDGCQKKCACMESIPCYFMVTFLARVTRQQREEISALLAMRIDGRRDSRLGSMFAD